MAAGLDLHLVACRLTLRAQVPLDFPIPAANRFRGALGFDLPGELFRPTRVSGPSGYRDVPRPFVLRAHSLDGKTLAEGEAFEMGLNLFAAAEPFRQAMSSLTFASLEQWDERLVQLDLSPSVEPCASVRVRFVTPTELKPPFDPSTLPPFATLLGRLRDRLSALRAFYGPGGLDIDHAAFGRRALKVTTGAGAVTWLHAERLSARTGQTHPLGGFIGYVEYSGELAEFLPFLEAGYWTGVGRQTVWGKGMLTVERL